MRQTRVDWVGAHQPLEVRMVVRRVHCRCLAHPREGARVLADEAHAVGRNERAIGAEQHECWDALDAEEFSEQRGAGATVREREPRHRRARRLKVGRRLVERDKHDLEALATRLDLLVRGGDERRY